MRYQKISTLFTILLLTGGLMLPQTVFGNLQTQTGAQEKAATLRAQLSEVEAKQSELQKKLAQVEENLKAENIEHSLAGVGSTRPEELREQRRRQFEIERNGLQAQLNLLAATHTRLETSIAQADVEAYRQSAAPENPNSVTASGSSSAGPSSGTTNEVTTPQRSRRTRKRKARKSKRTHHAEFRLN